MKNPRRLFSRSKPDQMNEMRLLGEEDEDHRIAIVKTKPYRDSQELQKL